MSMWEVKYITTGEKVIVVLVGAPSESEAIKLAVQMDPSFIRAFYARNQHGAVWFISESKA